MTGAVTDFVTRGRRRSERRPGSAEGGVYIPSAPIETLRLHTLSGSASLSDGLRLEDPQHLTSEAERTAYEHLTGLLLDTTISGVIRNEYLYLASSLNGEIVAADGTAYDFSVSDTFVSFTSQADGYGSQSDGFIETDGEALAPGEISKLFYQVSNELTLKGAWRSHSGLAVVPGITFGTLEVTQEGTDQVISLPVESRFGEWKIELRSRSNAETLSYSLTDLDRCVTLSLRTADAVLSDVAEGCAKDPDPVVLLEAMLTVATAA